MHSSHQTNQEPNDYNKIFPASTSFLFSGVLNTSCEMVSADAIAPIMGSAAPIPVTEGDKFRLLHEASLRRISAFVRKPGWHRPCTSFRAAAHRRPAKIYQIHR
jgi:hypothetical protein